MKGLYIITKGLWESRGSIAILMVQIFLMCLVFNILTGKFVYIDHARRMFFSSKLENALLFVPAPRFCDLIFERYQSYLEEDIDDPKSKSYYELKKRISQYSNIKAIGSISNGGCLIHALQTNDNAFASFQIYDPILLENLELPLLSGKLSDLLIEDAYTPVIVSYPLGKMYDMGSEMNLTIMQNEENYNVKTTVKGVLPKNYFIYTFPGGASVQENILLSSLIARDTSHDRDFFLILPPFILDDQLFPLTVEDPSFCIFRSETITNSTANRSLIPGQIDH